MRTSTRQKGFTLIEAMIAIAIVGIISLVVTKLFTASIKAWLSGNANYSAQYEVRTSRDAILRMLRQAQGHSIEINRYSTNEPVLSMITFYDASGNSRYAYWQQGDKLMQGRWDWAGSPWASARVPVSSRVLIAKDVNRAQFYYPNIKDMRRLEFMIYVYRGVNPNTGLKSAEVQMNGDIEIKNP